MKVTCRKAPNLDKALPAQVVVEVWMSRDEAAVAAMKPPETDLEAAQQRAINEHLRTGHRVTHQVSKRRPL